MAFCKNCGAAQNEGMVFCANCGTRLEQPSGYAQPGQATYNQPNQQPYNPQYQQFYNQPYIQPQYVYVKPKIPGKGLGIASMVLGIIGLLYSFSALMAGMDYLDKPASIRTELSGNIILVIMLASLAIMAVSFSVVAKKNGYKNGISTSGLITGIIGLSVYFISAVMFLVA